MLDSQAEGEPDFAGVHQQFRPVPSAFQAREKWDTVYTPIFNIIERPMAPALVIRVETDWFVHDTEFRYVLQPGETISASHNLPIGQLLFVPREEITLRDGTEE
ncbi:MAG TPA: hypothetical protein VN841_15275 [Bryobacteraceae bacterium]|nr:hypothetical protein [Bryobacteraceae bacterium]